MSTKIDANNQIEPTSLATAIENTIASDPTTVLDTVLTGYVSAPGTVTATDTILEAFEKIGAGGGGAVDSVFGRTGTVTAQSGDYTATQVGLGNVDNTSDANKPVSTATQTALNLKADLASPTFTGTVSGISKSMVGLGNVDNTSDANKPISTATQTALDLKVDENASITGATKTKITYDSKGLVTAGTDATTTDIAEGTNLYFTEARTLGTDLAGFSSAPGIVTSADTILTALNKLDGNVSALDSSVILKGSWNATTGVFPGAGIAQAGWSYIVSVAGTQDGVSFDVNDRIIAITDNASTTTYANNWFKADYTDNVLSVFGRTGAVVAVAGDYASLTETLTNKTIALGSNSVSGTLAQFNTACTDAEFLSDTGIATVTNKTINLSSNTLLGTTAQFNSALSDGDFATLAGTETLTSKTIALGSNTVSGTTAQFNTALTDGDFATLAGTESLTNKTLVDPTITIGALRTVNSTGQTEVDGNDFILIDASGGNITFNLLGAATRTRMLQFRRIDTTSNTVTIDANGAETIDGQLTVFLNNKSSTFTIVTDNSVWRSIGNVNEAGQIKSNYTTLQLVGYTANVFQSFDINGATGQSLSSYPTTTYPYSAVNRTYADVFDAARGTTPTGRLIENPVMGQTHIWRVQGAFSNKTAGNAAAITIRITNLVSGFTSDDVITLPVGNTSGTFTAIIITVADGASIPSPSGYVLQSALSETDANFTTNITAITRVSLATD